MTHCAAPLTPAHTTTLMTTLTLTTAHTTALTTALTIALTTAHTTTLTTTLTTALMLTTAHTTAHTTALTTALTLTTAHTTALTEGEGRGPGSRGHGLGERPRQGTCLGGASSSSAPLLRFTRTGQVSRSSQITEARFPLFQVRRELARPNPVDLGGLTGFVSRADSEMCQKLRPGQCLTWIS